MTPSQKSIQKIESHFIAYFGRAARYLPSGRLGLYAACCELFPPGARLIISPVTDDIVLFAILAAGLQPIFIDIDPQSGGLRPDRIPEAVSKGAAGIITSNLYGIPDDAKTIREACDLHRLILIEDCAHAMVSTVGGKRVGTFGEVSIFSMNKHVGFRGGVLTGQDKNQVEAIYHRAEPYLRRPSFSASFVASSRVILSLLLRESPRTKNFIKKLLSPFASFRDRDEDTEDMPERVGHRVPVRNNDFEGFEKRLPLDYFDRFLKVDNPTYRKVPCWMNLYRTVLSLRKLEQQAPSYRNVTDRIDPALHLAHGQALSGTEAGFFKIPFFVRANERHYQNLSALGVVLHHIYSPAFPHYLPSQLYVNLARDEATVLKWSRDILPIPLNDLDRVMAYFRHNPPIIS